MKSSEDSACQLDLDETSESMTSCTDGASTAWCGANLSGNHTETQFIHQGGNLRFFYFVNKYFYILKIAITN